ncbi:endolytic transglycosylase MltG [Rhizobium aquaticum]
MEVAGQVPAQGAAEPLSQPELEASTQRAPLHAAPHPAPPPSQGPIIIPVSAKEALRPTPVPAPPPKLKKSRGSRSQVVVFLNFLMTVLVFLTIALAGAIYYGLSTFSEQGPSTVNSNFIVKPGWGLGDISRGLEASNLISDARVFQYVTKSFLRDRTLKAGEYEIKAGASMKEIVELMESGKSILYSVTLPEGLTVQQIFDRLRADTVLEGDLPAKMPDEGTLRPDTYKFTRGAKRAEIVAQMKAAQSKLVDDIWARRSPELFLKTKEQFVTLASIVEKETGKADERTLVASVFLNRLEKKMRLQSDPTIIYGIFGGAGKPSDRPIYQSDLKKMTPYNTYVIDGLPPGPICNPGRAALEAVANPSKTSNLYFVADGTGGHVFAATLEEHNANVKKWRQVEDQQTSPTGTDAGATAPAAAPQQ